MYTDAARCAIAHTNAFTQFVMSYKTKGRKLDYNAFGARAPMERPHHLLDMPAGCASFVRAQLRPSHVGPR